MLRDLPSVKLDPEVFTLSCGTFKECVKRSSDRLAAQGRTNDIMAAGRPSIWDRGGGRAPSTIGGKDEKYDVKGLFRVEHDDAATWDAFIHAFTQKGGGTERAWDKKIMKILNARLAHYLKIADKRTIKAIAVAAVGHALEKDKTNAKFAKDAYTWTVLWILGRNCLHRSGRCSGVARSKVHTCLTTV